MVYRGAKEASVGGEGEPRGTGRTRRIDLDHKLPASFSQSRPALFHSVT